MKHQVSFAEINYPLAWLCTVFPTKTHHDVTAYNGAKNFLVFAALGPAPVHRRRLISTQVSR